MKPIWIKLRATSDERDKINEAAKSRGLGTSKLIRRGLAKEAPELKSLVKGE